MGVGFKGWRPYQHDEVGGKNAGMETGSGRGHIILPGNTVKTFHATRQAHEYGARARPDMGMLASGFCISVWGCDHTVSLRCYK